ncbi:Embryonic stem cell-specific 5-hydroxymethylcytosine-binding protein [Thalictrum thalictroides]|uniref:Embryonic stem cell-specific 5-hydroxymethylcytosine-binding protein n=1 Tax=Thalictrum thalictroides TaxID=46969 RepID=A0A7J6UZ21_THATH|nr:Embryonic stem cell-specific 5-hydroxymethylcytosine-binding protein [Thalictrum thalictroides]
MCGRARCTLRADDVQRACGLNNGFAYSTLQMDRYHPRYNVSPGSYMPVVRTGDASNSKSNSNDAQLVGVVLHCMKWGLIPSFTNKTHKPDHYKMFNARSESISEKPSFRRLLPNNRCLVAVEGFYEWKKDGSKKQPYYIHFKNGQPLVFAALYDHWTNSEGEVLSTFTIVTTSCSSALQWLHDRMPVILDNKSSIDAWLNGSPSSKFSEILKPYEDSNLVPLKAEEKNLISKFFSKKKVDNEQESHPKIESSCKESVPEAPENYLEEEEFKTSNGSEEDEKCVEYRMSPSRCGKKRDYKELTSESNEYAGNMEKMGMSRAVKKKSNLKNVGDKQKTLLSFFGRKS